MNLGLVFKQGDPVLVGVFLALVLMSVLSWCVLILRSYTIIKAKKANKLAKAAFWNASSLSEAENNLQNIASPIANMTQDALLANRQYASNKGKSLAAAVPRNEYLTRHIRKAMDQALRPFDCGLTALASIGATAPFIGLFGTVWGIYHALLSISKAGMVSIAVVAEPIGEALVATAAGLFVAIPAVLAYNALVRFNKTMRQDLDAYAHDLHAQLLNQPLDHQE